MNKRIILTKKMIPSLVTMFRSNNKTDCQLSISIINNLNLKNKQSKKNYDDLIIKLIDPQLVSIDMVNMLTKQPKKKY